MAQRVDRPACGRYEIAMPKPVRFIWKKTCSTCRNARAFLLKEGVEFKEDRELNGSPLSVAELEALIGKRDHKDFLNTRNELYRERGMKADPPERDEALKLMAEHVNLIRRPLLIVGPDILFGFDEKRWKETLSR
jgi:arsenate reductase-like glutaredoxin family protein